ncbi:MAG: FecR domain-containing protein [Pseudomonadota bacterium]
MTNPKLSDAHQSPREIAATWIAKELRGKLSVSNRAERDKWLSAHEDHAEAYAQARAAYDAAADAASHPDILAMRDAALQASAPKRKGRSVWIITGAAAAIAACALLAFGMFGGRPPVAILSAPEAALPDNANTVASAGSMRAHYSTRIGERLTATLDDGSVVTLNTNSELRIRYSKQTRRVELVRGQALFKVAHCADWPFIVAAKGQAVRALGTEFEVRLDGPAFEVVLVQGRVAVGDARDIEAGRLDDASELEAGERLIAAGSIKQIFPIDAEAATSWRWGRVSFTQTPLPQAIAEMNRYRTAPLIIADPRVAAMNLSGTYRTADAMTFEQTLAGAVPVDHLAGPGGQVELVWRRGENP